MSGWTFDEPRFLEEVLKPVQDGWPPAHDLFRVYLLPPDVADAQVVARALDEVKRQFAKQQYRAFRGACDQLRAQHPAAAALLTDPHRRKAHRAEVLAGRGKLTTTLRHRLDGAPGLPPSEVAALARNSNGAFTRSAVRAALAELGAAEREPAELPPTPQPGQWAQLPGPLAQLGHASLWAYLNGSGEFAGAATAARHLTARRERLRVSRSADSAAETTVLKLVEQWLAGDGLAAALRHEVLAELGREAEFGYPATTRLAAGLADRLPALGLPADHRAVAYTVWAARRFGNVEREFAWTAAYQSAVRAGELRGALEVLTGQPGLSEEWQAKRDELRARLAELDRELARCRALERTDTEAAVEAYLRIRAELADPAVDVAIERCRPAPAGGAVARVDGDRVIVSWRPSPATAGRISYRVTRGDTVVAETAGTCTATDPRPPGGTPLVYRVLCLRDGNAADRSADTGPVTVLPDVTELELQGGSDAITGRWRLPDGAAGVVVSRRHGTADESALPGTHATSFTDRDVRPGDSYEYRVRARYRLDDGSTALSQGARATAGCQEVPVAVTDLRAEFDGDEIVADWTPPARGEVELLELRQGEAVPDRAVVPAARARRHGTALRATGYGVTGHLRSRANTPGRRLVLLPVTVLGELAAIGAAHELDARHGGVRSLRVLRLGEAVRLTWEWPPGATEVRVVWRTAVRPSGPTDPQASFVDVTRVAYDSRGVEAKVGPGEHWFGVCTVVGSPEPSFGPLVLARESTPGEASYRVRRTGLLPTRRRWILVVEGPPGSDLPPVVLLARTGLRPMNSGDGEVLLRLPGGASPMQGEFVLPPALRRPAHLRAFSAEDRLVLIPARPDDLVVT